MSLLRFTCVLILFSLSVNCSAQSTVDFVDMEPRYGNRAWYVSGTGSDLNNGRTIGRPFRTLQKAANQTLPGDTVWILNGTYTVPGPGDTVLYISRSGTKNFWIRYKAYPNHTPVIQVEDNWGGITVGSSAYIEINGLTVQGNRANVTLEYAKSQAENLNNPVTSGNGISVARDHTVIPHHILIRNCHVYDCCGGGISTEQADYIRIENNVVHNNAYYSPYAQSGISIYASWNIDSELGFKQIIRNNASYGNRNYIPSYYSGAIAAERRLSDGNGIIIDDLRNSETAEAHPAYVGATLVTGNDLHDNGGRGIMVYRSNHVVVSENLSTYNAATVAIRSEFLVRFSANVDLINNVIFPKSNRIPMEIVASRPVNVSNP